jgi:hypothetical protein
LTRPRDYVPFVVINFQPSLFDRASFTLMLKYSDRIVINPSSAVKRRQTTNDRQVTDLEALRALLKAAHSTSPSRSSPGHGARRPGASGYAVALDWVEAKPPLPARRTQR